MDELPIETSVDEFVQAIVKETGDRVTCTACGHNDWATYDATPLTLHASNLRPEIPFEDSEFGIQSVTFACRRCGLLRFHVVDVSFPAAAPE